MKAHTPQAHDPRLDRVRDTQHGRARTMNARRSKAADQSLQDMRRRGWLLLTVGSGGLVVLLVLAAVVGMLASTGGH